MMKHVYLYGGEAKYTGGEAELWHSPILGGQHKFICFVAQERDAPDQEKATKNVAELGFSEIQIGAGKPIYVESLNDPQMEVFRKHYESSMEAGFSLVWYP